MNASYPPVEKVNCENPLICSSHPSPLPAACISYIVLFLLSLNDFRELWNCIVFNSCNNFFLGFRLQAKTTGQRLKDLNFKYTKLVCSTLIRAIETADIIASYLPDVPRETCCMLREGAPVKPDPSSPNWKPEKKVSGHVHDTGANTGFFKKGVQHTDHQSGPL